MTNSFLQYVSFQSWLQRAILRPCVSSLILLQKKRSRKRVVPNRQTFYSGSLLGILVPLNFSCSFQLVLAANWLHINARCLILRSNGELSLLDLDDGHERGLADFVELFWVTCGQSDEKTNLIEEVSWLDYGCRGMQVRIILGTKYIPRLSVCLWIWRSFCFYVQLLL